MPSAKTKAVVAGFSPIFVLAFTLGGLWLALTASAEYAFYVVLALSVAALTVSGISLSNSLFNFRRSWPFAAALFVVLAGWVWQRYIFVTRLPNRFLEYGYFLKPAGRHTRWLLLQLPESIVAVALTAIMLVAVVAVWRDGARASIVVLIAWSLVAYAIFEIPALYLSLQGDAAIFI